MIRSSEEGGAIEDYAVLYTDFLTRRPCGRLSVASRSRFSLVGVDMTLGVAMGMFVGEVAAEEEFLVGEDLLGGALGDQSVLLAEDVDPVGDEIQRIQVMGGGDDRVARLV
jgi:hypothetical protein